MEQDKIMNAFNGNPTLLFSRLIGIHFGHLLLSLNNSLNIMDNKHKYLIEIIPL
jgi:hypothetical protein